MTKKAENKIAGIMRLVVVGVIILAQLFFLALIIRQLKDNSVFIYFVLELLAVLAVLGLLDHNQNSSYRAVWLVIILVLPVFGYILYMLWGRAATTGRKSVRTQETLRRTSQFLQQEPEVYAALEQAPPGRKRMASFLIREGFPLYKNTRCQYFPLGELQ
ncbi:MAG TPA: cardiolipin synthase, partial [Firmicutes bacterium]|nr:cardiolipin synthase [Bacillota bacterium]